MAAASDDGEGRHPARRRSRRQRLQETLDAPEVASSSALLDVLEEEFALGCLSAPQFQKICAGAEDDGLDRPSVSRCAAAGARGRFPGNTHRDLMRSICPNEAFKCHFVHVPLKLPNGEVLHCEHPVLYPHQVACILQQEFPVPFSLGFF